MSSIFEVPTGLLFVLSLVTANPSDVATAATGIAAPKAATAINLKTAPCRHSEQAWYDALKNGAGGAAFSNLANRIFVTSGGGYYVPVAKDRHHLLKLQRDNAVSCFIALSSAAANADHLNKGLGRDATLADLYLAHIFGGEDAVRILKAVELNPKKRMADLFPNLDKRAPGLYAGRGRRMTLARFSNKLRHAIRTRVAKASGRNIKRRVSRGRRAKRKASAKRRLQTLVQKAHASARAINQRGSKVTRSARWTNTHPQDLNRFNFAAGIGSDGRTMPDRRRSHFISF